MCKSCDKSNAAWFFLGVGITLGLLWAAWLGGR